MRLGARSGRSEVGYFFFREAELRVHPAGFVRAAMVRPPWPYPISFGFFSSGESTRAMGPEAAAFFSLQHLLQWIVPPQCFCFFFTFY
jgi:hypothetical protein